MRNSICINGDWRFFKEDVGIQEASTKGIDAVSGEKVDLPHTWNAVDGQDGGNDYYRGRCWYVKKLPEVELQSGEELWMEFRGAAMMTAVYVNGKPAGKHDGGYSAFRVNLTPWLEAENTVAVSVDNGEVRTVYPQKADFTFYGGIYRDVYLLRTPKAHFALGGYGGSGLKVTPDVKEGCAMVTAEAWTENAADGAGLKMTVFDADGESVGEILTSLQENYGKAEFEIRNVHLWDGKEDPYLYTLQAELFCEGADCVETQFGCRTFHVDSQKGFFLNGRSYPLCGAARHQDRQGVGNALTPAMHEEDMALLLEMGANTVRTAHY